MEGGRLHVNVQFKVSISDFWYLFFKFIFGISAFFVCRHLFIQDKASITCSAFHKERNLLVLGFSNGIFGLYEMPEFNQIHSLR